jgi:nucleotide-binding universal stress UspA family protein
MFRVILVGTDGSDAAAAAVATAVELAQSFGPDAALHVATVINYVGVPKLLARQPPNAPDLLGEEAEESLERAAAICAQHGVEPVLHRLRGEIVEALLACADEIGAQLLVIGAHGRSGFVQMLLGSVPRRLVYATSLPVVVVRDELHAVRGEAAS